MLAFVYAVVDRICGANVWTVIGHKAELVRAAFPDRLADSWVLQAAQNGTGHALQCAWPQLRAAGMERVAVVNGDTPLLPQDRFEAFLHQAQTSQADLAFMTLTLDDPGAYGRVVRQGGDPEGRVQAIIEAKDYSPEKHGPEPREINAGVYYLNMSAIEPLLGRLTNDNKSGEFYITDLIGFAVAAGRNVIGVNCGRDEHLLGVNSPKELLAAEELLRAGIVEDWIGKHVMIRQRESVRIGPRVRIAPGASLVGPCEAYGDVEIGANVCIESHCWIRDSRLENGCHILPFSHIEQAQVGPRCHVGPYARLRPAAVLKEGSRVGNFVEMKKAVLGVGAKANHLTYLGDAEVGAGANVGAGTITCNYDGKNKHKTVIGENAFIGSNTALVAPVTIGEAALVGAGSVITHDVPDNMLAVARGRQVTLPRRKKP